MKHAYLVFGKQSNSTFRSSYFVVMFTLSYLSAIFWFFLADINK